MTLLVIAGLPVLLIGILVSLVRVIRMARNGEGRSAMRVLGMTIGIGLGGYVAGTFAGIWVLCSPADASNLCGIGGILGAGPLAAGASLLAYARGLLSRS